MRYPLDKWLKISFFNLLLISAIGVILRYKITFSLPFLDQKHLLHGHSHFAFTGWITHTLMVLMVHYLSLHRKDPVFRRYRFLLYANLFTAYGMLISFPIQGYGIWSISFSTLSIFTSYAFAIMYWKDLNSLHLKSISHLWLKAALVFSVLSSLGAFSLATMMAAKIIHQNWYLIAVYFFLHFQYNGWFFFAGMGLITSRIAPVSNLHKQLKNIFWLFLGACVPAYFLSALWLPMHSLVYWIVVLAAFAQVTGWILFIRLIRKNKQVFTKNFPVSGRWLLLLASFALTIKLLLQLGSTIPSLSQLAFGFRPIVIGYLHLVLLGIISIFLVGYIITFQLVKSTKTMVYGIYVLVAGIFINELLLMTQGVAALGYHLIPFINESLLIAALIMFSGITLMNIRQSKKTSSG
ncbi:MAG: hypothetical protein Q8L07_06170 [Sediminibacterium sp.]|nr:hypothetical protein [Sediminibacterium sp.]